MAHTACSQCDLPFPGRFATMNFGIGTQETSTVLKQHADEIGQDCVDSIEKVFGKQAKKKFRDKTDKCSIM